MNTRLNRFSASTLFILLAAATIFAAEKKLDNQRPGLFRSDADVRSRGGALIMPELSGGAVLPAGYLRLYEQKFDKPAALQDFVMTDPAAWRLTNTNGVTTLELVTQSEYKPAVRSPVNIALVADQVFADFIMEVDLIQTGKEYGHRDMCLFFGFQDPTHFYYTHIATAADPHAHNIFAVTNAPRIAIAKETTKGVNWGLGVWHKVKLERNVSTGSIKVYFDDMLKPIMAAEDKTFTSGYIGFGSFDDTGMVDNVKIWGPKVDTKKTGFFKSP